MDLNNKVAIVTGGASGIGRTISLELAKNGATVVLNYNTSKEKAETLIEEIKSFGGTAFAVQANVGNFEDAKRLVEETVAKFGNLHIVVNNAGITDDGLILRMQENQFDRVIETNLKGVWNVCKHAARPLMKSGYGRIVNISSISGVIGNAGQSNYSAAKAGIIGLSKSLARELAARDITVNVIAPGFIDTDMTSKLPQDILDTLKAQIPLKRTGTCEDVAHAVVFLSSPFASYITGQVLLVDGGMGM